MAINFNTEPYYDDYDEDKKYYKILFKPGVSVQARELTQVQDIIQKQVERHGSHIFKEGARVSGGEFGFTNKFYAVKLQPSVGNLLLSDYIDQLVDVELRGEESGVTARVITYTESDGTDPITIYVTYTGTGDDKTSITFNNDENLICVGSVINGIPTGSTIAKTLSSNSTAIGASASIERGVYYVNGYFVLVDSQRIILDKYNNTPSARVGLEIREEIVTADDDLSLLDTAQNAPNFSARGADRYTISLVLATRDLETEDDNDFIELERINEGRLAGKVKTSEYSELENNLARRTYDESGDYVIKPFQVKVKETLNDGLNNGVYFEGSETDSGNEPSDELMTLQVSTGKAYVRGYEISLNQPAFIDIDKPRDFVEVESSSTTMELGNYVRVNNVYGMPTVSTGDSSLNPFDDVLLTDAATSVSGERNGNIIGVARARAFELENADQGGSVDVFGSDAQFRLYLFDIKMFTEITTVSSINTQSGAIFGSLVRGAESQAVGYINSASESSVVRLTSVVGTFREGEDLLISYNNYDAGSPLGTVSSVVTHGFENVKQTYSYEGTLYNTTTDPEVGYFSSDLALESSFQLSGSANISGSTITGLNAYYTTELRIGDALSLPTGIDQDTGAGGVSEIRYVDGITNNQITLSSAVTTDVNSVTIFRLRAFINDQEKHILLRRLDKEYTRDVSDVSLTRSYRQFVSTSNSSGEVSINVGSGQSFTGLDNDNYTVVIETAGTGSATAGQVINVESDDVSTSGSGSTLTITSPSLFGTGAIVKIIAGINKVGQVQKTKVFRPASLIEVPNREDDATVIYGTSSKHREISLGTADVTKVLAVFESANKATTVSMPSITVSSITGSFVRGEVVRGVSSGATGIIVDTTTTMRYVSQNSINFQAGETIIGVDSDSTATIVNSSAGSKVVTQNFLVDTGQRDNFYDIGKIVRKSSAPVPTGNLLVVFDSFSHSSGHFFTVNSYSGIDYGDIPSYTATRIDPEVRNPNGIYDLRSSIDFRPRVADPAKSSGTVSGASIVTGYSFDFEQRVYTGTGSSLVDIPADNSNVNYDYSYFLARQDALFMTTDGQLKVIAGIPAENPKGPEDISNGMRLADIVMAPYVISLDEVEIKKSQQRRYTMKDIGLLEKRISNIEYYTSLSLLEKSAEVLQIKDANGLDRFKSGFLVDNFGGHKTGDVLNRDYRCAIDMTSRVLRPKYKMKNITLEEKNVTPESRAANHYTSSSDIVTLPYDEIESIVQPYATRVENLNPVLNFAWAGSLKLEPSADEWFEIERLPDVINNVEGNFDTVLAQNKNAIGTVWNAPVTDWTGITSTSLTGSKIYEKTFDNFVRGRGRRVLQRQVETEVGVQTRTGIETTVIEQIDISSDGDRVVAESLIPYIRSREVLFEARGLKPFTRVYPFFDKVNVSSFVTPTSGSIIAQEGVNTKVPKVQAWDKIKVIQVSYDNNSNKDIDIVLSRTNDIKRPDTWNSGAQDVGATSFHNHRFNTSWNSKNRSSNIPRLIAILGDDVVSSNYAAPWYYITVTDRTQFRCDGNGMPLIDANEIRIWGSSASTGGTYFQYKDDNGNWVSVTTDKSHPFVRVFQNATWSEDSTATQNSAAFYARSTTRSTNRTVTEFNFEDAPLSPNQFGEGLYRFRFFDRNNDGALRGLQISEVLFFDENYDPNETYEWNIENALIPNVDYSEVVASYNMKNVTNLIDGGKRFDSELGTWVIDGVNYRSDSSAFSEATVAAYKKGEAGVDIRVRGGTRTAEDITEFEYFAAPGTQQGDALVTDAGGFVSGIFQIPDPNVSGNPLFETGERLFRLTSDPQNGEDSVETFAQNTYSAKGVLQQKQETFTATRNGVVVTQEVSQETTVTRQRDLGLVQVGWYDPLAQSIMPSTPGGEFITSIEVFFSSKDDVIPVTCQLREMQTGLPTTKVIPFGSKTLQPEDVRISNDGTAATRFTFDAPVFLKENVEVAIVLATDSDKYLAWISRMGEKDVLGNRTVSEQPYLGVLFKSQNNSTWTAYDYEDLKFTVYRASFDISQNGIVELENTDIPMQKLGSNPIKMTAGSSDIVVYHDDHGMYDTNSGTSNYALIDGLVSGVYGTLPEILEVSASSFVIEGAVDAGFPTDTGTEYTFIVRTSNPIEAEDLVVKGTVAVNSGDYTVTPSTTIISEFPAGSIVEFYELNGIPLDQINNVALEVTQPTIDTYVLNVGTAATETDFVGGSSVVASHNAIINDYQLMVPVVTQPDTAVKTSINFLNGTSPSGSEVSYGAYGEKVTELVDRVNNKKPGMIASPINELNRNNNNRSMTVKFEMSSSVENLSPIIDLERKSITTYVNRIDNIKSAADTGALEFIPATDPDGDSGEAIYITKRVQLQNPATSIKVLFDAVRNSSAEIQVMYKVLRSDDSTDFDELGWNYFNGDGSTDRPVPAVSDRSSFREYEYTQDNIPEFISFAVKIKMNGTNSSEPPLIKDLRAIALAL